MKSKGHGLSVLLYNLFSGSEFPVREWFSFIPAAGITREDISWSKSKQVVLLDPGIRFLHRYSRISRMWNHFLFFLYLPKMLRSFGQDTTQPIFIPIGASSGILYRIWLIQFFVKNPVWLYPVDDLHEIAVRQNKAVSLWMCNIFLKKIAGTATRIFAISNGLGNVFSKLSGKSVEIILPCFQRSERIDSGGFQKLKDPYTFIFTGGLSFLYNDSLLQFTEYLKLYAKESKRAFHVIVQTYSHRFQFDAIGFDLALVEYRTSESRDELYKTYRQADAFLVPYSFDQLYKGVTTTSFPQKVAQLIQLGKPLVVFGPDYGSVVQFFEERSLDFVINENTYAAFVHTMNKLMDDSSLENFHIRYSNVYDQNFAQEVCLEKLKSAST